MSISSYVDCLKNTALKNPIGAAISEALDKLNEISIIGLSESAIATLTVMKDSLLEQAKAAKDWVVSLKDSLPLLKASDEMSNKMKIMKGIMPSINGGSLITGITTGLESLATSATTFATDLKNTVSAAITGGISAIEGMVTGLADGVSAFATDLKGGLDSVTESIGGAISDLKDYAFAKFSALPQPPALSELMSKILPDVCEAPRPEVIKAEEDIAREVAEKKYEQALTPATPTPTDLFEAEPQETATNTEDIPAPVVNGKTPQEIKDSVYAQIDGIYDKRKALAIETTQLLVQTRNKKYELYPDYDEVKKQAYEGNLTAKNKYDKMLAEMERIPPFTTWVEKHAEYDACEEEITRLQKLLKTWAMNNYENVPNGPPW